jgi:hypothetical protein
MDLREEPWIFKTILRLPTDCSSRNAVDLTGSLKKVFSYSEYIVIYLLCMHDHLPNCVYSIL